MSRVSPTVCSSMSNSLVYNLSLSVCPQCVEQSVRQPVCTMCPIFSGYDVPVSKCDAHNASRKMFNILYYKVSNFHCIQHARHSVCTLKSTICSTVGVYNVSYIQCAQRIRYPISSCKMWSTVSLICSVPVTMYPAFFVYNASNFHRIQHTIFSVCN